MDGSQDGSPRLNNDQLIEEVLDYCTPPVFVLLSGNANASVDAGTGTRSHSTGAVNGDGGDSKEARTETHGKVIALTQVSLN